MKKLILSGVVCAILLGGFQVSSNVISAQDEKCCSIDTSLSVEENYVNEDGNAVMVYSDGVEVEKISDKEYIIRDYTHSIKEIDESGVAPQADWITIGRAIITFIKWIVDTCQALEYVTGHDICRTVLNYIGSRESGTYTYELTGRYIPGYIPGCEPMHSLPCNSGYWEYNVKLV